VPKAKFTLVPGPAKLEIERPAIPQSTLIPAAAPLPPRYLSPGLARRHWRHGLSAQAHEGEEAHCTGVVLASFWRHSRGRAFK